jgi:hypothetical protein
MASSRLLIRFGSPRLLLAGSVVIAACCGAGVTLAIALSCTGVALFVGACVAGFTAFTVAIGELQFPKTCRIAAASGPMGSWQ